jgi:hypothetical protein
MPATVRRPTAVRDDETARQISRLINDFYRETGVLICSVEGNWHAWIPANGPESTTSGRELVGTNDLLSFVAVVRQAIREENES